jgi:hypothetical protein
MRTRNLFRLVLTGWVTLFAGKALAQQDFGSRCTGNWKGMMSIYSKGVLVDSVPVTLEVTRQNDSVFRWKMDYLSAKMPITKDYRLIYKGGNHYQIDEGDGIRIDTYLFVNRLVSVFETQGILLTSSYEWKTDELYFEVTSGMKQATDSEVQSYQVGYLQNVHFKRD